MPKAAPSRRNRSQTSTSERRARADRVKEQGLEMTFRCKRCEEKNLRCFVDTATGRCAGYISVKAECSLFVSKEEWEKVEADKRRQRLALLEAKERQAQATAETARLRVELARTKALERSYADRDHAILNLQDRAQEEAEGSSAPGTDLFFEPPLPEPSADLGWLQANVYDPSFDYSFLFAETVPIPSGFPGGTPVPVTCSSSGFLQVPKCYGFRAIPST
ncbi:hypothetical protein DDE83_009073 [Stemphylium lycopersici]|uniref:Uncharacterized protein n=1 Tax=Stemphylium lycopersici TaxID=183478 RepID=A0A364MS04_STELY|nr:hypothetical protein DDE83_009073 [Stemphylium lycopersici]